MRRTRRLVLGCLVLGAGWAFAGCKDHSSSAVDIAEAGWHAHDVVMAAGERAASCADAGVAMEQAFVANRPAFVAAFRLDQDKAKLQEATDYLEAHEDRYGDLETRMQALEDRCAADAKVQQVFREMAVPDPLAPP